MPNPLPEEARGDGPCMDCDTLDTPVWYTDNSLWNRVVGGEGAREDPGGFLCPTCFIRRTYDAGILPTRWRLIPDFPERYEVGTRLIQSILRPDGEYQVSLGPVAYSNAEKTCDVHGVHMRPMSDATGDYYQCPRCLLIERD